VNDPVGHCLDLCRQVLAQEGDARVLVLRALACQLDELAPLLEQRVADEEVPMVCLDPAGYVTDWNAGAETLLGYSRAEALGRHILFIYADDDGSLPELFLEQGGSPLVEVRRRRKSGEIFWAALSLVLERDETGAVLGIVARLWEIADRLSSAERNRLHARIIEDSDQGIMIIDRHEHIVSVNTAFTRITGYSAAESLGQTPDLLRSGVHDADFRAQVRSAMCGTGPWQGEIIGKRKSGELFPQAVTISTVRDGQGNISYAFSIFSDISAFKAAEERMLRLANYDSLTGLPNRSLLNQLVGQALAVARRKETYGALLMIDLKRFTAINDTLGYEIGDALLCEASRRFTEALRDADVLARIGGDEFAVALLDVHKREHAGFVAQKLLATLVPPIRLDGHDLHVGASIGIAVFPEDADDTPSLLRFAEVAMKRVQAGSESAYLFYSPEMNQRAREHLQLENELRRAISAGELVLHYQPKVSLRSGRIVGAEALIRWQHPVRGMVAPYKFIPVAEETGLILELGAWVLEAACQQIRSWEDAGLGQPPIAVNLSARQFDAGLPMRIGELLARYRVRPDQLKLEITESLLVRGADKVIAIMNELVAMGLALALDDFGTGYSSLAYLTRFPITTLKIDRSFVLGLPAKENDCAVARAIVTMAQQLRQEIVAEGVETRAQMTFLRELGCDQLQGYLFSPPVEAHEFAHMLRGGLRLDVGL
jgi:diguanylate cyclase (GGDEF)-like protein/PAS domain S-box-containing protein